jgi:hypothetical protein
MKKHFNIHPTRLIWILMLASCSPVEKINISNVNEAGSSSPVSFLYALPQTVIDIDVTAEETTVVPGPYAKYAEKYLGIEHVPLKTEKKFVIENMLIHRHNEADPDFIYAVQGMQNPYVYPALASLIKDSLILGNADFAYHAVNYYAQSLNADKVLFTDLSMKRNFEAEKKVEVSLISPDSGSISAPRGIALKEKTLEQKAEEAANLLIRLKKRRFKLVSGQYPNLPDGQSISDALQELSRIENEYLALFIGKSSQTKVHRSFQYLPLAGKVKDRVVLFGFSASEGIVGPDESNSIPVILELTAANKTKGLLKYYVPQPEKSTLYYRIPDQVAIKLYAGEDALWAEGTFPVYQCGAIVPVSLSKK